MLKFFIFPNIEKLLENYKNSLKMKISFCTTCMNRTHHLKETLPQNIRDNPTSDDLEIEFVVLNYNSQDDMHEWMTTDPEISKHIKSGLIRYAKTEDPEHFHMAHAKNMAHRLATGDVVCNLDADNFTGAEFANFLKKTFKEEPNAVINPSVRIGKCFDPDERGFFGRVAIRRENFMTLHGYNEDFSGWGDEDTDFMQRAKGMGLKHLRINNLKFLNVITHTNEERVEHMFDGEKKEEELRRIHKMKHETPFVTKLFNKSRVLFHPVQANRDGHFGNGNITLYPSEQKIELGSNPENNFSIFRTCALGLPELLIGRLNPESRYLDDSAPQSLDTAEHKRYDGRAEPI